MPRSRSVPAALTALAVAATVALTAATTAPASTATNTDLATSSDTHTTARVRQSAKLLMHPQIAQTGSTAKSSTGALSSMTASFKPVRKGRVVALQRKQGRRWVTVARKRQDRAGRVEFNAPFKVRRKVAVYRVLTAKKGALARKPSAKVSANKWGSADFVDEFSGTTLSSSWAPRGQSFGATPSRQCARTGEPEAASVAAGRLQLSVLTDPGPLAPIATNCPYDAGQYAYRSNGMISTDRAHSFLYGYAAARIKFQDRRGQHGSFWMQPDMAMESSDSGAEIDVIEWFGEKHPFGGLTSFAYREQPTGENKRYGDGFIRRSSGFGTGWADKYHVFSVEWTPSAYVFRIDGKETRRITDRDAISQRHQYLILSLLSSDYELQYHKGALPEHMYVDWVKHWGR